MKKKTKRFLTLSSLMILFFIGCAIIFYNLRGNLVFFYSPTELLENNGVSSQKIRLGGMVKKESVFKEMVLEKNSKIQKTTFFVTDFQNEIKVNYKGILPDLFKEGQGVVVEGNFKNNSFNADNVLAKHDENYMPPELKNLNLNNDNLK
ncbi:MAG: cytochrome c maturation protein CcmE [Pseudomonadota bacterium]|nr:cytochrome c maturation protein CcmE [Pseudomonadota bacterium]